MCGYPVEKIQKRSAEFQTTIMISPEEAARHCGSIILLKRLQKDSHYPKVDKVIKEYVSTGERKKQR